jgi:hypothetical protein
MLGFEPFLAFLCCTAEFTVLEHPVSFLARHLVLAGAG